MKHLLAVLLLVTLCAATGYGQTVKALAYNTTNGEVVYSGTNALTFTNDVTFSNVIATEFKQGANFSALRINSPAEGYFTFVTTNTNDANIALQTFTNGDPHKAVLLGIRGNDAFIQSASTNVRAEGPGGLLANLTADTISVTDASGTRDNLGLGAAWLTNSSEVALMRALSGSTNTNHPFSGSVSVVGTNNTNTLVFSNGILQEVQ
jgi:hypothetical protein